MSDFLSLEEKKISKEFEKKGFLIRNIKDQNSLNKLKKIFKEICIKNLKLKKKVINKKIFSI